MVTAPPIVAPVQVLTVINDVGVSPRTLARVERAVEHQVKIAGRWWHLPTVRFGPGGWPISLSTPATSCKPNDGCHWDSASGPAAAVDVSTFRPWTRAFDHEVLEMLADPTVGAYGPDGDPLEICDPVGANVYRSGGVVLADFVLPAWFSEQQRGRLDYLGVLRQDGSVLHSP